MAWQDQSLGLVVLEPLVQPSARELSLLRWGRGRFHHLIDRETLVQRSTTPDGEREEDAAHFRIHTSIPPPTTPGSSGRGWGRVGKWKKNCTRLFWEQPQIQLAGKVGVGQETVTICFWEGVGRVSRFSFDLVAVWRLESCQLASGAKMPTAMQAATFGQG